MVTLFVTFLNLGFRSDFLIQWVKAYFIAWPVAAATAFFVMMPARRLTERIVSLIYPAQRPLTSWFDTGYRVTPTAEGAVILVHRKLAEWLWNANMVQLRT